MQDQSGESQRNEGSLGTFVPNIGRSSSPDVLASISSDFPSLVRSHLTV